MSDQSHLRARDEYDRLADTIDLALNGPPEQGPRKLAFALVVSPLEDEPDGSRRYEYVSNVERILMVGLLLDAVDSLKAALAAQDHAEQPGRSH